MADNLDNVFVSLNYDSEWGMPILEWALDHFDSDKTKIILTPCFGSDDSEEFTKISQKNYLPRCAEKKFIAEILIPEAENIKDSILELVNKHGMRKLVFWAFGWNSEVSTWYDENPTICYKIWVVNEDNGRLRLVRDTRLYPGRSATTEQIDELLKKENEHHRLMPERRYLKQITIYQQLKEERDNLKEELNKLQNKETEQAEQWRLTTEQFSKDRATLATMKDRLVSLESDNIKLLADRDSAVKEADKLRNQTKHSGLTSDFTLQELEEATQNFSASLELGKGAFGCVYKGYIREKNVAIKILNSESMESISGFNTEVAILSTIRHPNIVTLLGACRDASALVFELLPNGSLESHLACANKTTTLTWQIRTRIMAEISLALIFLHSNAENMIIHGDLKPDNILLDAKFVSKLGDFGISRFLKKPDRDSTACYETYHPIGTPGYMDPEFVNTGMLTEKSDVYSFGVVILRLLTRKPAMCIALHVENAIENGTFHEILDASAGEWPLDQAKELAKLALRCAQVARKARPYLFEVWPIIERLRHDL